MDGVGRNGGRMGRRRHGVWYGCGLDTRWSWIGMGWGGGWGGAGGDGIRVAGWWGAVETGWMVRCGRDPGRLSKRS